ncbi:hypothetical protein ES288_A10G281300v1 [Gossypium darwinii]|uniref:Uncharacterized protein n=1 Tax=Gossypium darwinii TaxID=34276 RepID=A0A5D2F5I8_GOSDA|nr:hypothetical protein ES288_A10G281300v1 [Gossypium darwinii]
MQRPRFELPEALEMEILSKLPVKSLTRFNYVCKYWCSSFQTPHFISKHHHNNLNLLIKRYDKESFLVKQDVYLPLFKNEVSVCGASHGLLCLHDSSTDKAAIWNPSTREFKILPPSSVQRPSYLPCIKGYRTLNDVSFHHIAFGFDSKTDDYKVIRFVTLTFDISEEGEIYRDFEFPNVLQVELYSLRSDSWKEIPFPNYKPTYIILGNNYIDGISYWQTITGEYDGFREIILSFDLRNEKFSILSIPEFVGYSPKYYISLLVFNGSLSVIFYLSKETYTSLDLWVTNDGVWTKQFSIKSIPPFVHPLGFGENGKLLLISSKKEIFLVDPSTQELKELEIMTYQDHFLLSISLHAYVESLIRINGIQEPEEHIICRLVGDASNKY